MKWTAERIEAVRAVAASGVTMREVATRFGVGIKSIEGTAHKHQIKFSRSNVELPKPESQQFIEAAMAAAKSDYEAETLGLRGRWFGDMPRLRAEVERIKAEGAAS